MKPSRDNPSQDGAPFYMDNAEFYLDDTVPAVFDSRKPDGDKIICLCFDRETAETIAGLMNAAASK